MNTEQGRVTLYIIKGYNNNNYSTYNVLYFIAYSSNYFSEHFIFPGAFDPFFSIVNRILCLYIILKNIQSFSVL